MNALLIALHIGYALLTAAAMLWEVFWTLALGFILSAAVQALVSKERMQALLGRDGFREIAIATGFGAASSSCSYAAAAMSKTLFKGGAALTPSLAFLFSSTNLVLELGIVLWALLGWQFTLAEWIGGLVLIAIMSVLVRLTFPRRLIAEARAHVESATGGHDHGSMEGAGTFGERLRDPATRVAIAQNFAMDVSMLWKDLIIGFLIAGVLATFVPADAWKVLFLTGAPPLERALWDAFIGPLIAVISFVCSIGNVPLAAVLWTSGISFAGVLAFLYADLIVLPLLDVYRRYYGLRMAAYIAAIFFVTIVLSALLMDGAFQLLHLVPQRPAFVAAPRAVFAVNATLWLNLILGAAAAWLWWLNARNPMDHGCHHHENHDHPREAHHEGA